MLPLVLVKICAAEHPSALWKWYNLCLAVIFHSPQQWGRGWSSAFHHLVMDYCFQCLFRDIYVVFKVCLKGHWGLEQRPNFGIFYLVQRLPCKFVVTTWCGVGGHTWIHLLHPLTTCWFTSHPLLLLSLVSVYVGSSSVMSLLLTTLCTDDEWFNKCLRFSSCFSWFFFLFEIFSTNSSDLLVCHGFSPGGKKVSLDVLCHNSPHMGQTSSYILTKQCSLRFELIT